MGDLLGGHARPVLSFSQSTSGPRFKSNPRVQTVQAGQPHQFGTRSWGTGLGGRSGVREHKPISGSAVCREATAFPGARQAEASAAP